jgi:Uma2 family endonuclease
MGRVHIRIVGEEDTICGMAQPEDTIMEVSKSELITSQQPPKRSPFGERTPDRCRDCLKLWQQGLGSATALSVEEYLHTSFPDLDREYRDGELVERTLPDYLHGKTQALLAAFFLARGRQLSLHPCVETRMRVRPTRILIPDVAVFHPSEPDDVPEAPPLIALEILSPDDRLGEVREKLEEYRTWGVPHVWVVDPRSRRFYTCDAGLTETSSLRVSELDIEITPHDLSR